MTFRHPLALVVAILLARNSTPAPPTALGVVMEANRAYLNHGVVSAGTTVYDGDHFITEPGGMLLLRGDGVTLELAEESSARIRGKTSDAQGTHEELIAGTLNFSATRASALEIEALGARICPAADTSTMGQVSVAGPRELRIYAKRGALLFSYREESKTILEGTAFRVVLDAPENQPKNAGARKPGRHSKAILFIAIGAGVAGASWAAAHEQHHGYKPPESPDRP